MAPPRFTTSLYRFLVGSFLATVVDFGSLILFVEWFGVWYVLATAIAAFLGAVTNFFISRQWAFMDKEGHMGGQMVRYAIAAISSLLINTGGVYVLTDFLGFHYPVSKLIIAAFVGICFNFPVHRNFVFGGALKQDQSSNRDLRAQE